MEVKIIRCSRPGFWYSELIGEKFNVVKWGRHYVLQEDLDREHGIFRHISIDDCKILSE